jgi:hypothetical protein
MIEVIRRDVYLQSRTNAETFCPVTRFLRHGRLSVRQYDCRIPVTRLNEGKSDILGQAKCNLFTSKGNESGNASAS